MKSSHSTYFFILLPNQTRGINFEKALFNKSTPAKIWGVHLNLMSLFSATPYYNSIPRNHNIKKFAKLEVE